MRVGRDQLQILVMLGSPTMSLVVPDRAARALIKRGMLRASDTGGFACITPLGLRVLADEMEAGHVDDVLSRMKKETAERQAACKCEADRVAKFS